MYFESFDALLHMDGHGVFVWAAYLITLVVIVSIFVLPLRRKSRFLRQMKGELRRAAGTPSRERGSHASGS